MDSTMANRLYRKFPAKGPASKSGGKVPEVNEKTVAWPGLPGKTQPRNRSGGSPKVKIHPVSQGI